MTYRPLFPPCMLAACLALCAPHLLAAQVNPGPAQQAMRPDITLASAKRLIEATMQVCHAAGKTLVVAVVDRGGNLVALQRDDEVGPHNTLAAQRKAYTALSTKTATRLLADSARANPASQNLNTIDELLLIGGGVPIKSGAAVIGAIGVAGAGGAAMDESCALTAIERTFAPLP